MRNHFISLLLGVATTVVLCAPLPARATVLYYKVVDGKDSLNPDTEGLEALKSIGLSLASIETTDTLASGYPDAFGIRPPEVDPRTDGILTHDTETDFIGAAGGAVRFNGSITFNVDTTKLNLLPQLAPDPTKLKFDSFSAEPSTSQIFLFTDTPIGRFPLFDVVLPPYPITGDFETKPATILLDALEFTISKEFNDILAAAGATKSVTGVNFARVRGDRTLVEINPPAPVPEPGSVLAILTSASAALALGKRRRVAPDWQAL